MSAEVSNASSEFYNLSYTSIDGQNIKLSEYKDKVLLIVNTASRCGYTSQYEGLEALNKKYSSQGLVVIGFPSNDFGQQEPGTETEIKTFCKLNYGVSFALAKKVKVLGENKDPIYKFLVSQSADKSEVAWNFEKFLVGRNGKLLGRFLSKVKPEDAPLVSQIEKALSK